MSQVEAYPEQGMVSSLQGRTALVIGGSGGIGQAVAFRLGRMGARVGVGYAAHSESAERVARKLREEGRFATAVEARTDSPEACQRLLRSLHNTTLEPFERGKCSIETDTVDRVGSSADGFLGMVDILVYAAGLDLWKLAVDITPSEWRRLFAINLEGAFFAAQGLLPSMLAKGWGRIIFIGSIWGEVGAAGEAAYAATKGGLGSLAKSLAKEVARSGVTVNVVSPGVIDTAMMDRFDPEEKGELLRRIPVGRLGTGEDVAAAVGFLASDEARYITGHVLSVNGGFDPLPD